MWTSLWSKTTVDEKAIATVKEIKKRVSDDGPRSVAKMHMLGTARQRKELAQELERILDV